MCTGLNPDFSLWAALTPYATRLVTQESGEANSWEKILAGGTKIAVSLGTSDRFDGALADFAETDADQNETDHAIYLEAVRTGRVAT
jgi:hypothetical protein